MLNQLLYLIQIDDNEFLNEFQAKILQIMISFLPDI